jgi:6-phosphogluconolactonase
VLPPNAIAGEVDGDNIVSAYSIGANGALTPVRGSPFLAGSRPISVAVDPTGKFAYVADWYGDNVSAYSIGANGALTPVPGSPFLAGDLPASVAVDPTAKFAYVANARDNNVSAYSIGANGALTSLPGSPFAAGSDSRSVAITPLVPFASSFAKLEIAKRGFVLGELFTLGAISNGINPLTQNLALQIGTFSVTIPQGSFKQIAHRIFVFQGSLTVWT